MKKLTKLKLTTLNNRDLDCKEMNALVGGNNCGCACAYEGQPGGSTTGDNTSANYNGNRTSDACLKYVAWDGSYSGPIDYPSF